MKNVEASKMIGWARTIRLKQILFLLFILPLIFVSACINEEDLPPNDTSTSGNGAESEEKDSVPTIPYKSLRVQEIIPSDANTITLTQTFNYIDNKLVTFNNVQSYMAVEPYELVNETTLSYQDNKVTVTDGFNNVSVYTLNEYGYATHCVRNQGLADERYYLFEYYINDDHWHYLTQIEEYLPDDKLYSKINFEPIDKFMKISQQIDSSIQYYIANSSEVVRNLSAIPHPFLIQLHPLSMHEAALYGRLLGEPYSEMITQIKPEGNEENLSIAFKSDDEGWFTNSQITTSRQNYKHTRNISYTYTR